MPYNHKTNKQQQIKTSEFYYLITNDYFGRKVVKAAKLVYCNINNSKASKCAITSVNVYSF